MFLKNTIKKFNNLHKQLNGLNISYDLSTYQQICSSITCFSKPLAQESDSDLRIRSDKLKIRIQNEQFDTKFLIEAYSLVIEAICRVMKIVPFEVQIIAAIALYFDKLIEMQTGEGKTLTAVFPAYINALYGKGVHILTFNDYLAQRDTNWMSPVFNFLGLTTGCVQEGMSTSDRQKAYKADITYVTAKESGFDYLRDSICYSLEERVHREFNYAIIDEADSILIDEARIPLIIAGLCPVNSMQKRLIAMASIVKSFTKGIDFEFDDYMRNIYLTEDGITKAESILNCKNLFTEDNSEYLLHLNNALHAEYLLKKDKDYIVRDESIQIVDELTGRIADKRRWPDGLQAAIEAKENCCKEYKGKVLNSIPLQHFIRFYSHISGMTATAQAAAEEFKTFYNLDIVVIPTNTSCIRKNLPDLLFTSIQEKNEAIIEEICTIHKSGRPILVGTQSVSESAHFADLLKTRGISCQVLNAKNDEHEAKIIALAGKKDAITISTNMAGRGVDIRLGGDDSLEKEFVTKSGGLHVIGTNRYESGRIDNQLRGRSARQGDPGSSRFFMSLEDDLFEKYRLKELIPRKYYKSIQVQKMEKHTAIIQEIDRIQRIIEGQNLEMKITLFKYSILLEQQREMLSKKRNLILSDNTFLEHFQINAPTIFESFSKKIGYSRLLEFCRKLCLIEVDKHWSDYIAFLDEIRDGIHLRRIGGQNPLFEFRKISLETFSEILEKIDQEIIIAFSNIVKAGIHDIDMEKYLKSPSATWTYLVNDNPLGKLRYIELGTNVNLSFDAFLTWPVVLILLLFKNLLKKKRK